MGKSLNGKELGVGISQRKDGRYEAKFVDRFGKRRSIYAHSMTEITRKLREEQYLDEKMLNPVNAKMTLDEGFEDLVFCSKTNNPIHESNVRGAINCLVDKINKLYPDIEFEKITPHGLRHTFATKCIKRGMTPKALQKILGHSSLQMTMDLYCHVEEDTLRNEMALFENAG